LFAVNAAANRLFEKCEDCPSFEVINGVNFFTTSRREFSAAAAGLIFGALIVSSVSLVSQRRIGHGNEWQADWFGGLEFRVAAFRGWGESGVGSVDQGGFAGWRLLRWSIVRGNSGLVRFG
jgi:hypothetical protein